MAVSGPGPDPEPAQWLPACKVTALLPARSARPGGPLPAIRRHSARNCHASTGASAQLKRLVSDFADPLCYVRGVTVEVSNVVGACSEAEVGEPAGTGRGGAVRAESKEDLYGLTRVEGEGDRVAGPGAVGAVVPLREDGVGAGANDEVSVCDRAVGLRLVLQRVCAWLQSRLEDL